MVSPICHFKVYTHLLSKSLVKGMSYLRFYAPTRQGEAARDPQSLHGEVQQKYEPSSCGNSWAVENAAGNPGLIPKGNFGNSPEGGCAIDLQSDLLFGAPGTSRQRGPKQVFPRPFATTPFLGLGTIEGIEDQNKIVFGHSTANRKSIQTVTDKQFPVFEPLIPEKEADIPENNYFVEPFLRGGLASRLIPRTRVDLTS
jgi:hypothetical protein